MVNVKQPLFTPRRRMGSGGTAPLILNFTRDLGGVPSRPCRFTHVERDLGTH